MGSVNIKRQGIMFIFSAPSGGGKSSVIRRVLEEVDDIELSVSVTTRNKRDGEVDGRDYYFVSVDEFNKLINDGALYEYVDSDFGPKYGTPKGKVDELLSKGKDVILDLDYPGVQQLRQLAGDRVKAISFIPPSVRILRERLVNRGTDSMDVIERRMSMAEKRIKECEFYDYVVVNDDIDEVVTQIKAIILAARSEKRALIGLDEAVEKILKDK